MKRRVSEHPVLTGLIITLILAVITFVIVVVVKLIRKDEKFLEDEFVLDDGDDINYIYANENEE